MSRARRAFTLIEALVAVALIGIGVSVAVASAGVAAQTRYAFRQKETLVRLGSSILDDLIATGDDESTGLTGDFADAGYPNVEWSVETATTGIENLDSVMVTVHNTTNDQQEIVQTLVYRPPETSTTEAQ